MTEAQPEKLERVERHTTAERVERVLRDAILRGRYAVGAKLPAERELAAQLGVTRVTLRSALARLGASGLLSTVQGDGHRVRDVRRHGGLERLPEMAAAFAEDELRVLALVRDLLALRRVVVAEAAALCTAAKEQTRAEVAQAFARMEATREDAAAFARADQDFTRALLRASGNLAFELTFNTVVAFAEEHPELLAVLYADAPTLLEGVRGLFALFALGDPELTRNAVRAALAAHDEAGLARVADALRGKRTKDRGPGARTRKRRP